MPVPAVQMSGTCSAWQSRRSHCTTRRLAHTSSHNKTQAQQALTLVRRHSHIRWSCSRLCLRCVATRIVSVHLHGDHSTCTHIRSGPPPSCPHGVSSVALHCQVSLLEAVLFICWTIDLVYTFVKSPKRGYSCNTISSYRTKCANDINYPLQPQRSTVRISGDWAPVAERRPVALPAGDLT